MGREIRFVPANWKHPNHYWSNGMHRSLRAMEQTGDFQKVYKEWEKDLAEWYEGRRLWEEEGKVVTYGGEVRTIEEIRKDTVKSIEDDRKKNGFDDSYKSDEYLVWKHEPKLCYSDWSSDPPSPPNPDDYMPVGTWVQLFETVSEGTPLSPPFKTKEQLVDCLANNKDFWGHTWTREQAEAMVKDEYAPSMVMTNGKLYSAEESVLLPRNQEQVTTAAKNGPDTTTKAEKNANNPS